MQAKYNLDDVERLLSKVDFSGDCWRWTGSATSQGLWDSLLPAYKLESPQGLVDTIRWRNT